MTDAPRFDRHGEIRCLGRVADKGARKVWVIIRRKGGAQAYAITETEWNLFAETPLAAGATLAPRLDHFGGVR